MRRARFGPFQLDLRAGEFRAHDRSVRLQQQPFQILILLLESGGEVVTREEIRQALWSGETYVEFDQGIGTAMKKLRQALGDDAADPHYIETLTRRGYRWLVPVEWEPSGATRSLGMMSGSVPSSIRVGRAAEPYVEAQSRLVGRDFALEELRECLRSPTRTPRSFRRKWRRWS